jgi:PTH1 family peptidyl-tRNA hydrolase
MVVDELAQRYGIGVVKKAFGALSGSGTLAGEAVLLAKPQTYMNLSGEPVASLLRYFRLGDDALIVVHDDIDIECGRIKLAKGAGHGGHNGVRSIIETLGHKDFLRVRVGVGRPPAEIDGADYVLAPISKEQMEPMEKAIVIAADAVEMMIEKGLTEAQQKYHVNGVG